MSIFKNVLVSISAVAVMPCALIVGTVADGIRGLCNLIAVVVEGEVVDEGIGITPPLPLPCDGRGVFLFGNLSEIIYGNS